MSSPFSSPRPPTGGDLFHREFGDVRGGTLGFRPNGTEHISVYGNGGHFSWDVRGGQIAPDKKGIVGPHGTDHGGGHF